jgi:aldose 1-epimerase
MYSMKKPMLLAPILALAANAANYTAKRTPLDSVEVIVLADATRKTEVTIVPTLGNIGYAIQVNGKNALWTPQGGLAKFKARPSLAGMPFLAPWANRLDGRAFYANGKKYIRNPGLGNVKGNIPIHGRLSASPASRVVLLRADRRAAAVTSRLEFWKYPDMLAQFPFAHTIGMTYRLREGTLEVETVIRNHHQDTMPVSIGFHPYFKVQDAPREKWKLHLPVHEQWVLSPAFIPTGERKPVTFAGSLLLEGVYIDDVFTGLNRDAGGRAEFWFDGEKQRVSVIFGPKYTTCVLYAPKGRDYLCFEPMAAITNAMNMAQARLYKELQTIPPGGEWRESSWVSATGF